MHFSNNMNYQSDNNSGNAYPFGGFAMECQPTYASNTNTSPGLQQNCGFTDQQDNGDQNNVFGPFFQNNQNASNVEDQGWRTCRYCQLNSFVTSQCMADHEATCHMRISEEQLQQAYNDLQFQHFLQQQQQQQQFQQQPLQQQQFQQQPLQQQQQQFQQQPLQQQVQIQQQEPHQEQAQEVDSFNTISNAFQLSQLMPTPFAPFHNAKTLSAASQSNSNHNVNVNTNFSQVENQGLNSAPTISHEVTQSFEIDAADDDLEDRFQAAINRLPAFTANDDFFPLSMPEDEDWLTPLHCFVRRYCVEVFVATPDDVAAPCMGKRNPVMVKQVGIRCPFCSPERMGNDVDMARARENGVVYPSLISRIYNATINLLQRHLRSCAFVPPEILARYEELKSSNARSGASKKYWAESANRLGLVDTPEGIRLVKPVKMEDEMRSPEDGSAEVKADLSEGTSLAVQKKDADEAPPLVLPSDKRFTTAFTFHLIAQMQPCVFTEADRLGRRRGLDVGFAGLACRHCFGVYGSGRFFPSSVKTMSDASKTLDVIYKHVIKCKKCPQDIKHGLRNLREFHDSERSKMPFGNQRAFFTKIWGRLHENAERSRPGSMPALPQQQQPQQIQPLQHAFSDARPSSSSPFDDRKPAAQQKLPALSVKLDENNTESLQALYARLNRNIGIMHTKMANEAA